MFLLDCMIGKYSTANAIYKKWNSNRTLQLVLNWDDLINSNVVRVLIVFGCDQNINSNN